MDDKKLNVFLDEVSFGSRGGAGQAVGWFVRLASFKKMIQAGQCS